jgi:transposase
MPNFKQMPMSPAQIHMFPRSLDDSIPQDSDVRALSEAMDIMDTSDLEAGYSDAGCPAYPPVVLGKILVYGYSKRIRSSRALEDMVKNDKRFIWLAGGLEPDHSTISRFRKEKQSQLRAAYKSTVRICMQAGLVLLNTTSTDGTKILALASKKSLYDEERIDKVDEAIDRIFREAEEADRLEDEIYGSSSGREVPPDLADAKKRREKLREIAEHLKESDRKNVSSSDSECRVMKTTSGLRPSYNVQATVDSANLVIVAADLTDSENDYGQLAGQLAQVEENTGCRTDLSLADTGYGDERTFRELSSSGQEALIPPKEQPQQKDMNNLFASRCFLKIEGKDALTCPAGRELTYRREVKNHGKRYLVYTAEGCRSCSFYGQCVKVSCKTGRSVQKSIVSEERERMTQRLRTREGKALYALRQQTVEPVFGNIKWNMGFTRFSLHGKEGAMSETWLMCMAHNLKILVTKAGRAFLAGIAACFAPGITRNRCLILTFGGQTPE